MSEPEFLQGGEQQLEQSAGWRAAMGDRADWLVDRNRPIINGVLAIAILGAEVGESLSQVPAEVQMLTTGAGVGMAALSFIGFYRFYEPIISFHWHNRNRQ